MIILNTPNIKTKSHFNYRSHRVSKQALFIRTVSVLNTQHHNTSSVVKTCNLMIVQQSKRFMFNSRLLPIINQTSSHVTPIVSRGYACQRTFRLYKKAAKDYASDGTGKHTHIGTQKCIIDDCEKIKCLNLCDSEKATVIAGHHTHKPPQNREYRHISDKDVNGDPKPQFFVLAQEKKEITKQEELKYGKEIKDDLKAQKYVNEHRDKYE